MSESGVELSHIHYRIGDFAMRDLSLRIDAGEYFVLTGPNGAGKTILVKLICGLHRPESGTIRLRGRDVTAQPPWKRNIGYVPQDGLLFPNRTVEGNIRFALEVRGASARRIADAVHRVANLLNIASLLGRRVEGLSGGEQQKVALARALVFEPGVLLLDEPVSAIYEESRNDLCRELRRIKQTLGLTVVHISHNRRETDLVADRVGVLKDGQLQSVTQAGPEQSPDGTV